MFFIFYLSLSNLWIFKKKILEKILFPCGQILFFSYEMHVYFVKIAQLVYCMFYVYNISVGKIFISAIQLNCIFL